MGSLTDWIVPGKTDQVSLPDSESPMRTERPGKGPGKKPHPAPRTARYHVTCHVAAEISAGAGGTTCLCIYTAGSTTIVFSQPHNVTFSFANALEMADISEIFKCCYIFASVCLLIGFVGHLLVPRQICLAKKMAAFSFFAISSRYLRAGSHHTNIRSKRSPR